MIYDIVYIIIYCVFFLKKCVNVGGKIFMMLWYWFIFRIIVVMIVNEIGGLCDLFLGKWMSFLIGFIINDF